MQIYESLTVYTYFTIFMDKETSSDIIVEHEILMLKKKQWLKETMYST